MSDPYWDQTVLLLHCEGANNSTTFTDETYQNFVAPVGDTKISTAHKLPFGTSSAFFDGTGDYLSTPASSNFDFGVGDFTIELSVKFSTLPTTPLQLIGANGATGWQISYGGTSIPHIDFNANGAGICRIQANPVIGVWYRLTVSRVAGVMYCISDGVVTQSIAFPAACNAGSAPLLVGWTSGGAYLTGYMAEVRITKSVGRYTGGFTPSLTAFDGGVVPAADTMPAYWPQTIRLIPFDASTVIDYRHRKLTTVGTPILDPTQKLFGTQSLKTVLGEYYNASSEPLTNPNEDYTLECFLRVNAYPPQATLFMQGFFNGEIRLGTAGELSLFSNSLGANLISASAKIPLAAWVHFALTKNAAGAKVFLNGAIVGTYIGVQTNPTSGTTFLIGKISANFQGMRATLGVARYATPFVPPTHAHTVPLETDQHYGNVVLHCHFNGANDSQAIVDQKGHTVSNLSTNSSYAKISTTTSATRIYGGACLALLFDQGPYLETTSPDYNLGAGDFTIEFFKSYYSYSTTNTTLFELRDTSGTGSVFRLEHNSNNQSHYVYVNDALVLTNVKNFNINNAPPPHFACVRLSGVISLYINGVKLANTYNAGSTPLDGNGVLRLFGGPGRTSAYGFYEDLRVTKGVARYTANFTPPADPFPDFALQKLSGTVFDADNNPVAKTVRSYRSSDGMFVDQTVSNAITGTFELRATDTTEHFVVVHDATKNALVYDHIVPVI